MGVAEKDGVTGVWGREGRRDVGVWGREGRRDVTMGQRRTA